MKLTELLSENEFNAENTANITAAIKTAATANNVNVSIVVFEPVYEGPYDSILNAQAEALRILKEEHSEMF
jgi:hypothetical protein